MGQLASNMQNPNITGPQANRANWGDMDNSEKGARVLAGGTQGLAQGFQNYQNQNSQMRRAGPGMGQFSAGGQQPVLAFYGGQQPVDPAYFQPQQQSRNNLAFYGGY